MMFYLSIFVLLILVLYIGQVLGLVMQSYQIKQLKYIRGFITFIPFLTLMNVFYILGSSEKDRFRLAYSYVFLLRDKAVITGVILSNILENYLLTHPKASVRQVKKCMPLVGTRIMQTVHDVVYA